MGTFATEAMRLYLVAAAPWPMASRVSAPKAAKLAPVIRL